MPIEKSITIVVGIIFICVSIYFFFSKKPVSIYNNSKPPKINQLINVKKYNQAVSLLIGIYGLIFILEGLVIDDKLICLVIMVLTVMPGMVIVMAIYEIIILKKYLK